MSHHVDRPIQHLVLLFAMKCLHILCWPSTTNSRAGINEGAKELNSDEYWLTNKKDKKFVKESKLKSPMTVPEELGE